MRTSLNIILQTSLDLGLKGSDILRSSFYVNNKISEEIWEIDEEIAKLKNNQKPGKDGVFGEAIDTLISAVDLYALYAMEENLNIEQIEYNLNKSLSVLDLEDFVKNTSILKMSPEEKIKKLEILFKEAGQLSRDVIEKSLIMDGVSYKTATKEESFSSFSSLIKKSIDIFLLDTNDLSNDKKVEILTETVNKKVNKWREKRGLESLSVEIPFKPKFKKF